MDETPIVKTTDLKPAATVDPTPEQEKAAQEFADKMVQNIIKQLPPKPVSTGTTVDLGPVMAELDILRHNQYEDHLILEKIWKKLGMTQKDADKIDKKVSKHDIIKEKYQS